MELHVPLGGAVLPGPLLWNYMYHGGSCAPRPIVMELHVPWGGLCSQAHWGMIMCTNKMMEATHSTIRRTTEVGILYMVLD